jgi:signal transduction histidine kinase
MRDRHVLHLCVSDDGSGFDATDTSGGLGIMGMRERAALQGGRLTITSRPEKGTSVEVSLPLEPTNSQELADAY